MIHWFTFTSHFSLKAHKVNIIYRHFLSSTIIIHLKSEAEVIGVKWLAKAVELKETVLRFLI